MEDKIAVRLKEDVRPFMAGFIANKQADVEAIELAFRARDYSVIRVVAHRMQGASSMYGIVVLAEVCAELIEAARNRDERGTEKKIAELSHMLGRLEITYE